MQKWADGEYYEGDFVNDHRHGEGVYTYDKGSFFKGEWV